MGLFPVYLVTLQPQQHTGLSDISTKWSKTENLSGGVGVDFAATKHYHLSQPTKLCCQTKYTRCIYFENRNKLCVTRTEELSLQKIAICPRASKPIKVSVCTNLPVMWMCSFFHRSFLLRPLRKISESAMFWHLTTLDLLAHGAEPVSECLVSMRQIRGLKSAKMRKGCCFHTDSLYTWKLVITRLICSWGGPAGKHAFCGKRTLGIASANGIFGGSCQEKRVWKSEREQCVHKHKVKIKRTWAEPCCAKGYLQALNTW